VILSAGALRSWCASGPWLDGTEVPGFIAANGRGRQAAGAPRVTRASRLRCVGSGGLWCVRTLVPRCQRSVVRGAIGTVVLGRRVAPVPTPFSADDLRLDGTEVPRSVGDRDHRTVSPAVPERL
jgi:hypothetical protein